MIPISSDKNHQRKFCQKLLEMTVHDGDVLMSVLVILYRYSRYPTPLLMANFIFGKH